jgi:sugar phosphate isomerase/epimerase
MITDKPAGSEGWAPRVGASTFCLLFEPWREACDALLGLGFTAIELFGDAPQGHFTQLNPGDRRALKELSQQCELSLHAPAYELNVASANPCTRDEAGRQYREAVYLAHDIGASRLVLHEGHMSYWKLDRQAARQAAVETLRQVLPVARQSGVTIALENTNFGKFAMYDTWEEWAALAGELAEPSLRLTLDTGHAGMAGWDMPALLRSLASQIAQIHVHDTSGKADDHLMPGEGVIDWLGLRQALRETACQATLILESGPLASAEEVARGKRWMEEWLGGG